MLTCWHAKAVKRLYQNGMKHVEIAAGTEAQGRRFDIRKKKQYQVSKIKERALGMEFLSTNSARALVLQLYQNVLVLDFRALFQFRFPFQNFFLL